MTVYVDNMKAPFRGMIMCHMIADTDQELVAMAQSIGVNTKHHQGDHFDICQAKRKLAVQNNAVEINTRQAAAMRRRKEITGVMGSPDDAEAWLMDWFKNKALERERERKDAA